MSTVTAKALPENITGIKSFFDFVTISEPAFWPVMIGAFWIINFGAISIKFGASRAFLVSSLIGFLISMIISVIGWMNVKWMYLFLVLTAAGIFWRRVENDV